MDSSWQELEAKPFRTGKGPARLRRDVIVPLLAVLVPTTAHHGNNCDNLAIHTLPPINQLVALTRPLHLPSLTSNHL